MASEVDPNTFNLSHKDIQELYSIVAESKKNDLARKMGMASKPVSTTSANARHKNSTDSGEPNFLSLNWLMDQDSDPETDGQGVCIKCCCRMKKRGDLKSKSTIAAILAWDTKCIKTFGDFVSLINNVTSRAEETTAGLQTILAKLSFLEDPDPELQNLSVVGGYLWLTTYILQYITIGELPPGTNPGTEKAMDEAQIRFHPNPHINTRITETHDAYEEIGEQAQSWVPISIEFLKLTKELRKNSVELVKILQERFRIKNPFRIRPEIKPTIAATTTPRRSIPIPSLPEFENLEVQMGGSPRSSRAGLQHRESIAADRGLHAHSLKIQWSPTVVLVQATPGDRWEVFSSLAMLEKVELIAMFMSECLRLLSSCLKSYKRAIVPSNAVEQASTPRISNTSEMACGLLHFTSSSRYRKLKPSGEEVSCLESTVEKYWVTVDNLYEVTCKVTKLVSETRDIVQSCYIYSRNFYNLDLKNFELFDSNPEHHSREQDQRMKRFVASVVGTEVVDVAKFFSIADFSTSHYQFVLQHNAVSSHGMSLKLESWDEANNEPWGLLDNMVDKRKASKGVKDRVKSKHFTLAYHPQESS